MKWLSIGPKQLEWLGRFAGVTLGSLISPLWPMLTWVMKPYIDLQAFMASDNYLVSYLELISRLRQASPATLLFGFVPQILLCALVGIAFLYITGQVGMYLTRYFIRGSVAS